MTWPPWPVVLALDTSCVLPVASIVQYVSAKESVSVIPLIGVHVAAVITCAILLARSSVLPGLIAGGVAFLFGAARMVLISSSQLARPTVFTTIASPLLYVTALPLWTKHSAAAFTIVSINIVTAAGVLLMITANTLHEAWGCYHPGTPLSELKLGMCGMDFSKPWTPPIGQICGEPETPRYCSATSTPFEFFGKVFHFVVQAQTIALSLWFVLT